MCFGLVQRMLHRISFNIPGGYTVRPALHRMRGVTVGNRVWISRMVYIDELHPEAVILGDNVSIGLRVTILTHFYWGPRRSDSAIGPVIVEPDVFIGPHSVVLPNVRIGQGAAILAGTVVSKDVPARTLWGEQKAGPLARVTVPLTHHSSYEGFLGGLRPIRLRDKQSPAQ